MRAWAGHAVFAAVLIGSLAAQQRSADLPDDGAGLLEPAILRIADSHGLKFHEYRTMSGIMTRTLLFAAPGCTRPLQVSLRLSTFEEKSLFGPASEQDYTRHYIYFDRSWDQPDPRAAFVQRMKYSALSMLRLTEYVPSKYLLLVETPNNCRAAEDIDWSFAWSRDYLAVAHAAPSR